MHPVLALSRLWYPTYVIANTSLGLHHQYFSGLVTLLLRRSVKGCTRRPLPETVEAFAIFPHLDGTILGASGVQAAIRGEGDGPNWPMVALKDVDFIAAVP